MLFYHNCFQRTIKKIYNYFVTGFFLLLKNLTFYVSIAIYLFRKRKEEEIVCALCGFTCNNSGTMATHKERALTLC